MKNVFIIFAIAVSFCAQAQDASEGKIFVVPVDASGKTVQLPDGTYQGQVELTASQDAEGMSAKGVAIEGAGFTFFAESTSDTKATFYNMPSWATQPAIVGLENPLSIMGRYASVEPGTYDITYYQNPGYNYFTVKFSDNPDEIVYPAQIFLMSSDSEYVALSGSDGVYAGNVVLPASFRVSYERQYSMPVFIYGPTSSGQIVKDERLPLQLRTNTATNLTPAADGEVRTGDKVYATVSIVPSDQYIVVTKAHATGIDEIESPEQAAVFYDLGGRRLREQPTAHGVYIMLCDGKATKIAI